MTSKRAAAVAEPEALGGEVIAMAINERGDGLVAADQTGTVRVWRRVDRKWKVESALQLGEAPETVFFSPHGERVAYLKGAQLDVWDVAAGAKLRSLPTKPDWLMRNGVFDLPKGRLVAAYVNEQTDTVGWAVWDLDSGKRSPEFDLPSLGDTYANAIDLTKAGDRVAIGFDLALVVFGMTDYQQTKLSVVDSTLAVAFSPTNPYLAAANIRGSITVWNSATNRQLATLHLPTPTASQIGLAFSTDGGRLVAANANSIQVWDLTKADEITVMTGHDGAIPCAAFHPTGQLLATGGKDDEVRFWNPITGQQIASQNVGEPVQTLAFSPDGRLLAVGCMGRVGVPHLRLIDVESQKVVYEAKPAMGEVLSLAWSESADGRYLAGCGSTWRRAVESVRGPTVANGNGPRTEPQQMPRHGLQSRQPACSFGPRKTTSKRGTSPRRQEAPLHAPDMNQGWHGLALLPDGQSIIFVSNKGVADVWNVKKDRPVDVSWYTRYACRAAGGAEPEWNMVCGAHATGYRLDLAQANWQARVYATTSHCRRLVSGMGSFQRTPGRRSGRRRTRSLASAENPRETG